MVLRISKCFIWMFFYIKVVVIYSENDYCLVKKKINFDNIWVLWYFAIFSTFQKNFYNLLFQLFHLKALIKSDWTFLKFFLRDPVFPQSWSCPLSTSKPFTLTNPSSLVTGFFKYMFLTKTEQKGKIRKNVFGLFYHFTLLCKIQSRCNDVILTFWKLEILNNVSQEILVTCHCIHYREREVRRYQKQRFWRSEILHILLKESLYILLDLIGTCSTPLLTSKVLHMFNQTLLFTSPQISVLRIESKIQFLLSVDTRWIFLYWNFNA